MGPHGPDAPRSYYTGPLCPMSRSWEPCSPTKAADGPQAYTLNILQFQKKWNPGMYVWVRQRPHIHKEVDVVIPALRNLAQKETEKKRKYRSWC